MQSETMKMSARQGMARTQIAPQVGCLDLTSCAKNSLFQEWSNICAKTNYEGARPNSAVFSIAQLLKHTTPDSGSGFYSHLTAPAIKPLDDMPGSQYSPDYLQNLKILIVDDEPAARDVLQNLATSLGWQADVVSSGAEAIEKIRHYQVEGDYQLILMDWQMPHMNGFESCEKIRQLYLRRAMPVIIMVSASEQAAMAQQPPHKKALIDGYLLKPVTASTLILTSAALIHKEYELADSSSAQSCLHDMSILLVEDNKANQMIAMELLESEGARVILAENGEQALEQLKNSKNTFDVVLMDIQMPVMDGYQATREIRQTLGLQQLPIVAMSANAVLDMGTAYTDAAGRSLPDFTEFQAGDLSAQTLQAGLYKWGTNVLISTDMTFDGGANDVWILQIAGNVNLADGARIHLTGGALAKNIFWQVGGGTGVVIGTTAHFEGIILAEKGITVNTGATVTGRLLAQTAVTLDQNALTQPAQ